MNRRSKRAGPLGNTDTFWRQALLILLPIMILAWTGMKTVREDRQAADRDLLEQANRLQKDLIQFVVEPWIQSLESEVGSLQGSTGSTTNQNHFVIRIDADNNPVDLRMVNPLRPGKRLDLSQLDPLQRQIWQSWTEHIASDTGESTGMFIRSYTNLVQSTLPASFKAVAWKDFVLNSLKRSPNAEAMDILHEGFRSFSFEPLPTGVPAGMVVGLEYFRQSSWMEADPVWVGRNLEALLRLFPTPLNGFWLDALIQASDGKKDFANEWTEAHRIFQSAKRRWEMDQFLHAMHRWMRIELEDPSLSEASTAFQVSQKDHPYLCWVNREQGLFAGVNMETVLQPMIQKASLLARPDYFAFQLNFLDQLLLGDQEGESILNWTSESGRVLPSLGLSIHIVNPELYYASYKARFRRFSWLVYVSLATVLIGLAALWRGHRRQIQLSGMKSNFVAGVSHELRAPIASIRLMAEELEDDDSMSEERMRDYHRLIGMETKRLSHLVENVLDMSRIERGVKEYRKEPSDLAECIRKTCELMQPIACEKEVRLIHETETDADGAEVEMDSTAVQRAIINLIDNAVKFSKRGDLVRVSLFKQKDVWRISVADSGPGIATEFQDAIFQPFFRIGNEMTRETQGIGLGLALVNHVVEGNGGRVEVQSRPGKGSDFSIILPQIQ